MAKNNNKSVPQMSNAKRELLASFGIEPSNGRKGRTYGANKRGREAMSTIAKAVGKRSGQLAIVPQFAKAGESIDENALPVLPKNITPVSVPLTVAQVKRFAQEWADNNGRQAVHYRGVTLVK